MTSTSVLSIGPGRGVGAGAAGHPGIGVGAHLAAGEDLLLGAWRCRRWWTRRGGCPRRGASSTPHGGRPIDPEDLRRVLQLACLRTPA